MKHNSVWLCWTPATAAQRQLKAAAIPSLSVTCFILPFHLQRCFQSSADRYICGSAGGEEKHESGPFLETQGAPRKRKGVGPPVRSSETVACPVPLLGQCFRLPFFPIFCSLQDSGLFSIHRRAWPESRLRPVMGKRCRRPQHL